jgi:hypothetical protein
MPGPNGTVGDANLNVQLKQSNPDLRRRYQFIDEDLKYTGSMVNEGTKPQFFTGGGPYSVMENGWGNNGFNGRTKIGWEYQDIRANDRSMDGVNTGVSGYDWSTIVRNAKLTGTLPAQFLPVPGPYVLGPGKTPRGGNIPQELVVGDDTSLQTILRQKQLAEDKSGIVSIGGRARAAPGAALAGSLFPGGTQSGILNPIFGQNPQPQVPQNPPGGPVVPNDPNKKLF